MKPPNFVPVATEAEWRAAAKLARVYRDDIVYGCTVRTVPDWPERNSELDDRLASGGEISLGAIQALADSHEIGLSESFASLITFMVNVMRVTVYPHESLPEDVTNSQADVSHALITLAENLPAMVAMAEYAERATPTWALPSRYREKAETLKKLSRYVARSIPLCVGPSGPGQRSIAWHQDAIALYKVLSRHSAVFGRPIGMVNDDAKGVLFIRDALKLGDVVIDSPDENAARRVKNLIIKIRRGEAA
jgi:hypothetical protein